MTGASPQVAPARAGSLQTAPLQAGDPQAMPPLAVREHLERRHAEFLEQLDAALGSGRNGLAQELSDAYTDDVLRVLAEAGV